MGREQGEKPSAGGKGTLRLCAPSAEREHLPSRLLDPSGRPCPVPERPPAVLGCPSLSAVAQPPGGANALGHPGEPGPGLLGVASRRTLAVLSLTPLLFLDAAQSDPRARQPHLSAH